MQLFFRANFLLQREKFFHAEKIFRILDQCEKKAASGFRLHAAGKAELRGWKWL
jgi:hypothetical protein